MQLMRKKIAAANCKMNLTRAEATALADRIMSNRPPDGECILAAPAVYLQQLAEKIGGQSNLHIAAQDCSGHISGAYTGETSAAQLASIGVTHCLVGHSERRQHHGETD